MNTELIDYTETCEDENEDIGYELYELFMAYAREDLDDTELYDTMLAMIDR